MFNWLGDLVDSKEKVLKKLQPLVEKINEIESEYKKLSDDELKSKTREFKGSLAKSMSDAQHKADVTRQELQQTKKWLTEAQDKYTVERWEMAVKRLQEKLEQDEKSLVKQQNDALDDLLPEAFAAVREASRRTLGMRHFVRRLEIIFTFQVMSCPHVKSIGR